MIILGIDPGTAEMGWGIVENLKSPPKAGPPLAEKIKNKKAGSKNQKVRVRYIKHGVIKTPSDHSRGRRLSTLRGEIAHLIKEYGVGEIAAEKIFFNINKKTAISVGQALGIVHLAAAEWGIPVYEYNALKAKLLIAGYGRASKKIVQNEVKKRLRLKKRPTPVHAADALAVALCHILENDA